MGLFDVTQIALEQALAGSAQRQQLLANNLANADTPGFKRSDLDFHAALANALANGASPAQIASLDSRRRPTRRARCRRTATTSTSTPRWRS